MKRINRLNDFDVIDVDGYGAIAIKELSGSRKLPIVHLKSGLYPELQNFLDIQNESSPGDVESTWCAPRFRRDKLILLLEILRPVRIRIGLAFYLPKHGGLIEGIDRAKMLLIQPSLDGTGENFKEEDLIEGAYVGIGAKGFPVDWKRSYLKILKKNFRKEGMSKSLAKKAAESFSSNQFEFWDERVTFEDEK